MSDLYASYGQEENILLDYDTMPYDELIQENILTNLAIIKAFIDFKEKRDQKSMRDKYSQMVEYQNQQAMMAQDNVKIYRKKQKGGP